MKMAEFQNVREKAVAINFQYQEEGDDHNQYLGKNGIQDG